MTSREAAKRLKAAGFVLVRRGRHDIWRRDTCTIALPRKSSDLKGELAQTVLKLRRGVDNNKAA